MLNEVLGDGKAMLGIDTFFTLNNVWWQHGRTIWKDTKCSLRGAAGCWNAELGQHCTENKTCGQKGRYNNVLVMYCSRESVKGERDASNEYVTQAIQYHDNLLSTLLRVATLVASSSYLVVELATLY